MSLPPSRRQIETLAAALVAVYLTSFGQDNEGRIYVLAEESLSERGKPTPGAIYRLDPLRKEISD
jgi:hypothetical protein